MFDEITAGTILAEDGLERAFAQGIQIILFMVYPGVT